MRTNFKKKNNNYRKLMLQKFQVLNIFSIQNFINLNQNI